MVYKPASLNPKAFLKALRILDKCCCSLALDIFCDSPNGFRLFLAIALGGHHLVQPRQLRYVMGIPQSTKTDALRVLQKNWYNAR